MSTLVDDMPPYQLVDVLLGTNVDLDILPIPGHVVCEAGYYDRPQCFPNNSSVFMTDSPDEATEVYCFALAHSKYPNSVTVQKCWIHSQQRVFGA